MKYVAYYRVSTKRQGLGLDAQRDIVASYVASQSGEVIGEYSEKESGKVASRPELAKALELAKAQGATLIVAKLDRLTRDAEFGWHMRNSGVGFFAVDCPEVANTLIFSVMLGMAQHERELIAERTRLALAQLKSQGVKLGNPQGWSPEAQARGAKARRDQSRDRNANASEVAKMLKAQGLSLSAIGAKLASLGYHGERGGAYSKSAVSRLLAM